MVATIGVLLCLTAGASPAEQVREVDRALASVWRDADIQPAALCSDREFLRRISLDLLGRIPTVQEMDAFLKRPNRAAKIDQLLERPEFARFWSEIWTAMLIGYRSESGANREALRIWLEKQFRQDRGLKQLATRLITAEGVSSVDGPVNFLIQHSVEPAIKVSRTFLGVRIDCARCHDHPFDRWTQDDYRGLQRFFAPLERREIGNGVYRLRDDIGRARGKPPRFLTGVRPVTTQWRRELAFRLVRHPGFARAQANRIWYLLMGRGIVHPPDDMSAENKPAAPGLLELLAAELRENGYRLKPLIRRICNSDAYRRSSRLSAATPLHVETFACRTLKPLMPEQVFDSVAAGLQLRRNLPSRRAALIRVFTERTVGADLTNIWTYRESVQDLLTRLTLSTKPPQVSNERLFLRLLSRPATPREQALCRGKPAEDVALALINTHEFLFNH